MYTITITYTHFLATSPEHSLFRADKVEVIELTSAKAAPALTAFRKQCAKAAALAIFHSKIVVEMYCAQYKTTHIVTIQTTQS